MLVDPVVANFYVNAIFLGIGSRSVRVRKYCMNVFSTTLLFIKKITKK